MFLCNIVDSVEQWPSDLDQFLFTYDSLIHLSELISNYISYKIFSSSCFFFVFDWAPWLMETRSSDQNFGF